MRRYLGRSALGLAVSGWLLLLVGLGIGGLDPTPEEYTTLRTLMGFGLLAECLTVPIGLVAVVIGPYRVAAFAGLIFSAAYFLYFTGMIFMFFASRG
jgi:hypothetical protein